MPSTILSDNGASSGTAGIKTTGSNDGALALQTTTAGGVATTALTIDTSQNVGIGTSSPQVQLWRAGATLTVQGTTTGNIEVGSSRADGAGVAVGAVEWAWTAQDATHKHLAIIEVDSDGATAGQRGGAMKFFTKPNGTASPAERMRIDSSGNVEIGRTSALNYGAGGTPKSLSIDAGTATDALAFISLAGGGGGVNYNLGRINFGLSSNTTNAAVSINAYSSAAGASTGGNLTFNTSSDISSGVATERARITSGGYFKASGDGTYVSSTGAFHELKTSANNNCVRLANNIASGFGDAMLQCSFTGYTPNTTGAYFLYCSDPTNIKASILTTGTFESRTSTYGGVSDVKLKQDIVDASSQWDDIKNLRIRKFRFKDEVAVDPNYPSYIGLIAQEAELVSPGLVSETPDTEEVKKTREIEKTREVEVTPAVLDEEGNVVEPAVTTTEIYTETEEYTEKVATGTVTKSVKYSILYMKAVKALQEAMERIEKLEAEVAAMKAGNGN